MGAEIRLPQPAEKGDFFKVRSEAAYDPFVRPFLHGAAWHMSQPAVKAPVGAAVQIGRDK
jgi:hypothetical protein